MRHPVVLATDWKRTTSLLVYVVVAPPDPVSPLSSPTAPACPVVLATTTRRAGTPCGVGLPTDGKAAAAWGGGLRLGRFQLSSLALVGWTQLFRR